MINAVNVTAKVAPNPLVRPVVIAEVFNPESALNPPLNFFLQKMGFDELYPNFGKIRVTNIHPFAMFLFQDLNGQTIDLSLLPSICIADSSDSENAMVLGHDKTEIVVSLDVWTALKEQITEGNLITAASNVTRIDAAIAAGSNLRGIKKSRYSDHNIDLNIWSDNKDVTSIIFDLVRLFLLNETDQLRENGIDNLAGVNGRRSGDINTEFGRLLHGANVSFQCRVRTEVMEISILDDPLVTEVIPEYQGGSNG